MVKAIALTDAEVGMTLSRGVTDDKGMTLCSEGTPLTERLINLLKQREINTIYIESGETMTEEEYVAAKEKIEKRFAAASDSNSLLGKFKITMLERLENMKG